MSPATLNSGWDLWLRPQRARFSWAGHRTNLGGNQFRLTVSGTTGTTNEIQGTFDFQNWDFIGDLMMINASSSMLYTNNTVMPSRFFRAERLQ